jgi:predicted O-methyltransferase YrrM
MMTERELAEIARLWQRKLDQDAKGLPQSERHRNLEPDSAEFIHALAVGIKARNILEIGGSSGLSTIALASAARAVEGKLTSIEIEPDRQRESSHRIEQLALDSYVQFVLGDAAEILPSLAAMDLVLIDCEKGDYIRFFDMLKWNPQTVVVADNILSHDLKDYVRHVRSRGCRSITLPIGKGLEISRAAAAGPSVQPGKQ